jgi:hypothetical protein
MIDFEISAHPRFCSDKNGKRWRMPSGGVRACTESQNRR